MYHETAIFTLLVCDGRLFTVEKIILFGFHCNKNILGLISRPRFGLIVKTCIEFSRPHEVGWMCTHTKKAQSVLDILYAVPTIDGGFRDLRCWQTNKCTKSDGGSVRWWSYSQGVALANTMTCTDFDSRPFCCCCCCALVHSFVHWFSSVSMVHTTQTDALVTKTVQAGTLTMYIVLTMSERKLRNNADNWSSAVVRRQATALTGRDKGRLEDCSSNEPSVNTEQYRVWSKSASSSAIFIRRYEKMR